MAALRASQAQGSAMADISDEEKWARARAIADEEAALQEQYEEYKYVQRLDARFRNAGAADVIRMFETGTNEKGDPLSSSSSRPCVNVGAQYLASCHLSDH